MIEQLAKAGMNVARLNMSHGDHASHLLSIRRIRSLNRSLNHPVATLLDLKGPEIRTGELREHLHLAVGEVYTVTVMPNANTEERSIHIDYQDMLSHLKVGSRITVDNGLINLEVLEVRQHDLRCRVMDGGKLGSRKHINLPGIRVNLPSITEKDRRDIQFAVKHELDFIALSFVRSPTDVVEAREIVEQGEANIKLIAKIENQEGVDNFSQILEVADGIMVARGDLGVEVEPMLKAKDACGVGEGCVEVDGGEVVDRVVQPEQPAEHEGFPPQRRAPGVIDWSAGSGAFRHFDAVVDRQCHERTGYPNRRSVPPPRRGCRLG